MTTASGQGAPTGPPAHTHDQPPIPREPAAIQAAIEERQRRLASTVDELTHRVSPKEVARRGAASAQTKAREAVTAEDGSPRTERIAAVGAAALAVVGALMWRRLR
ncbi:MAG TPA: DUF3618 domain-containing protein [Actinomycetales bacterium]|nr:DUF3618 domain-containing protein [Actinomycetales bacterium]